MHNKFSYEIVKTPYDESLVVRFLYRTIPGRLVLKFLVRTTVSKLAGLIMDCQVSKLFVAGFVKRNRIDMDEYEKSEYKSFNDFFERKIKQSRRVFPEARNIAAAPSDGKLTAYEIMPEGVFSIKHSKYSVAELLEDKALAKRLSGGICLIYRLAPSDYHRYAYIDDGEVVFSKKIRGILHTVRPIAHHQYAVYAQNSREYEVVQSKNFGMIIQMEVGALFVGKINNHEQGAIVKRGEEKGYFRYGASTIVMLFEKESINLDPEIYSNTRLGRETIVKMGDPIGSAPQ